MNTFAEDLKQNKYLFMRTRVCVGKKVFDFDTFIEAWKKYPELNPFEASEKFTAAMCDRIHGRNMLRFEDSEAVQLYSFGN